MHRGCEREMEEREEEREMEEGEREKGEREEGERGKGSGGGGRGGEDPHVVDEGLLILLQCLNSFEYFTHKRDKFGDWRQFLSRPTLKLILCQFLRYTNL